MLKNFPENEFQKSILSILVLVIFFFMLSFVKKKLIKKSLNIHEQSKEYRETSGIIFSILQYVIIIVAIVIVLKINGYNVTSIIAGLGIFATLVGLALQDTLKDIISGIHIFMDNYYKVGDIVIYDNNLCEVKYFSTNVTKFRILADDSTITVANRNISKINKLKGSQTVTFNVAPNIDYETLDASAEKAVEQLKQNSMFSEVKYIGIISKDRFAMSCGIYVSTLPININSAKSIVTQTIYRQLREDHIEV